MKDKFYPPSTRMDANLPIWQFQMVITLSDHLRESQKGNRERESRLANRLGQLRRNCAFKKLTPALQQTIREAVEYLRSTGRKVNLGAEDPRDWITTRDGRPRW